MRPLRHVSDYLDLVASHGCTEALKRAARTGNYSKPQPTSLPWGNRGWRFQVWSVHSKWDVLIECREAERVYRVHSRRIWHQS